MMYIYRRNQHMIDALIEDHFWMRLTVNDGPAGGGTYMVTIFNTTFSFADPNAGADESDTIAAGLLAAINAGSEPVTAYAGANGNEVLVRFNFGCIPVDTYNQKYNYSVSTSDEEGAITLAQVHPTEYDVFTAANWDGLFASMQKVPYRIGHNSDRFATHAMRQASTVNAHQLKNRTRFLFDPADYSADDKDVLFYQITTVVDGETIVGPIQIVMSAQQHQDLRAPLILTGLAPVGATQEDALVLQLPRLMSSFVIRNKGGNPLSLGFGVGAAEITLAATTGEYRDNRVHTGYISVRGNTSIEIYATMVNSPLI